MNIDSLPKDVVVYEILPKLDLETLSQLSRTSKLYAGYVKEELDKRIAAGIDLSKDDLEKLSKLGKDPRFKYSVINEILRRLRANEYGTLELLAIFPSIGYQNIFIISKIYKIYSAVATLRSLLDNPIELEIDGVKTILSHDGAFGLFLGLYQTDTFQNHTIKLGDILIDKVNAIVLFFPYPDKQSNYQIELPNKEMTKTNKSLNKKYSFNSFDFLSNLKISGIIVNKVFDRKKDEWIKAVYQ